MQQTDQEDEGMVNVSSKAAEALHATLEQNERDPSDVIRIARTDEGLALAIGSRQDEDQVVEHDDRTILAIEPAIATALEGATLDAVESPEGMQLVIRRD